MNGGSILKDAQKRGGRKRRAHPGGCIFEWADGGIQATDAPGGTSLHPASRKTAASGQRNAGVGYGEGGTQTPRTGNNDCDVGTYRLGASDLYQTGGSYDGNDGSDKGRMPKNAKEEKDVRIWATDAPNRYVPTSGIAGKRRRAVNGMQGYSLSLHKTGGSPAMTCLKSLFSSCHCTRLSLSLHPKKFVHELYPHF